MKALFLRLGKVFPLALAHGAADLSIAGHLSAHGKGAADPEMLIDDLIAFLRPAPRRKK